MSPYRGVDDPSPEFTAGEGCRPVPKPTEKLPEGWSWFWGPLVRFQPLHEWSQMLAWDAGEAWSLEAHGEMGPHEDSSKVNLRDESLLVRSFAADMSPEDELLAAMIPVVEVLQRLIYEQHAAGCCMHITTDDGNIEDDHVRYCFDTAVRADHFHCASLAALLLTIPESMRDDALQVPMDARGD